MVTDLNRRDFVKLTGAATLLGAGAAILPSTSSAATVPTPRGDIRGRRSPNIVFIMVDELRFPMGLPNGVHSPRQFLGRYMPNVAKLWDRGVKFDNHFTAATSCGPARAALVTGLYPHQTWNLLTPPGDSTPGASLAPALEPAFPTYGKLLRKAGYRTPYVGKWHLSGSPASVDAPGADIYLEKYGFDGKTIPDVTGLPGQGLQEDPVMAGQAVEWLQRQKVASAPFCLTVSLVNPHDKQFFWAGTEATRFNELYTSQSLRPFIQFYPYSGEENPRSYGYSRLPGNWESAGTLGANKPACQLFNRQASGLLYGDASDNPAQTDYVLSSNSGIGDYKVAVAPFSYWRKARDSYTQVMELVDREIGKVIRSIPEPIRDDTIIVLTSDHGEYAGAHGMLSGKEGTMYDECIQVPLIVVDLREKLTGDVDRVRHGLTSSVDILPLLLSIAHGSQEWRKGRYATAYSERLNMLPMLKSASGRSRSHVLMASDEMHFNSLNFNNVPRHILGLRTRNMKVASYSRWGSRGNKVRAGRELESYDYDKKRGRLELENFRCDGARAQRLLKAMSREAAMSAKLPPPWQRASNRAKRTYLNFIQTLN